MPKIQCNNIHIYYETHGNCEGTPLVFIGGFSTDHSLWLGLLEYFKDYHCIIFDNRGAGQTSIPEEPYTIEAMAEDTAALCRALRIDSAYFIGNSMGGFILQRLAFQYPSLVKAAIISHSTAKIATPFHCYLAAQLELRKAAAPLASLIKAACAWVFSYQFLTQAGTVNSLIQLGLSNPYPFTDRGYEGQYAALEKFDSSAWVSRISVPTLVLTSDQDIIFSESSVEQLKNRIPQAEYYCFQNCGHAPQIEYPELLAKIVGAFIKKAVMPA